MEREKLVEEGRDKKLKEEASPMGIFGDGHGFLGMPISVQRVIIWILAVVFLFYSYNQEQILAGILGMVVAYVINRQ